MSVLLGQHRLVCNPGRCKTGSSSGLHMRLSMMAQCRLARPSPALDGRLLCADTRLAYSFCLSWQSLSLSGTHVQLQKSWALV